ncbi:MAG: SWIM zinc finger family protein [Cardiobacteriaceae bacterium]|nr:SWIM zinc finger family protein [Cardiobacteriaceae bacterium]
MNFTPETIQQLAPDASSYSSAKGLLKESLWSQSALYTLADGLAISGLCQGSGKNPYQVVIDLREPAFKCSCPSRKFPCKHGLALLLRYSQSALAFGEQEMPDWVEAWLDKRQQKQAKAEQASEAKPKVVKKPSQVSAKRLDNALAGVESLMMWLEDVIRSGLMGFQAEQALEMAKRMIDAQISGLAGQLQHLVWEYQGDGNREHLFQRLSALYSLCVMFKRREQLSTAWQAEVDMRLGFTVSKEEILAREGVWDTWHCVGITRQILERGHSEFYWLYGEKTKRFAFLMEFVMAGKMHQVPAILGGKYEGELCFYSGVRQYRALPKSWTLKGKASPTGALDLETAWAEVQSALVENPLLTKIPMLIKDLRFSVQHSVWYLMNENHLLPIVITEEQKLRLLSEFPMQPFQAAVLYDVENQQYQLLYLYGE